MKKTYTAKEIIEKISRGWDTQEELDALRKFIDNAKIPKKELEELRYSGYLELVYEYADY